MTNEPSKIGVLGSGTVGQTLAAAFLSEGHPVTLGTRDPARTDLAQWRAEHPGAEVGTFAQAAAFGEIIVVAVGGAVAENAVKLAGPENLSGKVVIDAANPISAEPPVNGVLRYFTGPNESLMERLQSLALDARFVKAFNSVGAGLMYRPQIAGGVRPTMFICGNDAGAKETVGAILEKFGWSAADFGQVESARPIEALCQLWCIPAMTAGKTGHAFHLLEAGKA